MLDSRNGPGRSEVPLWQRSWLASYPCDVPSSLPYPDVPVSALLENAARRFPDRTACTLYDRSLTYRQLDEQARRFARGLAELGAGPGRRVGMLLPNIPDYLLALHAACMPGATVLQLSPLMVGEEVAKWLAATDCQTVVTLDLLAPVLRPALESGPLRHLIVASLAERMPPVRGWLYRVERLRRRGPLRLREEG